MDRAGKSTVITQELLRLEAHRNLLVEMLPAAIGQHDPSVRLKLLLGSALKIWRMGAAARLLAADAFVEEIRALSRTMAEITINAAYLQYAEDEEVDRYQHFDTYASQRDVQRFSSVLVREGATIVDFVLRTICFYLNGFFHLNLEKTIIQAGKLTVSAQHAD